MHPIRWQCGLLGLLVFVGLGVAARAQPLPVFRTLSAQDGLAHDNVTSLLQDRKGFLWFGTPEGLSRYDGVRFTTFRHVPTDSATLLFDGISALYEDPGGFLWVGTNDGLSRFDPRTETFRRYPYRPGSGAMLDLHTDRAGQLWAATWKSGLLRLDPATGRYTQVLPATMGLPGPYGDGERALYAIYEDAGGVLWLGAHYGLLRFDPRTRSLRRYRHDPRDPASLGSDRVWSITRDGAGRLWLGTDTGLDHFDPATGRAVRYRRDPARRSDPVTDAVRAVHVDATGTLWLGTHAGLDRFDPRTGAFTRYRHDPEAPGSIGAGRVFAVAEDRTGVVWMGTERGGVSRFDRIARSIDRMDRLPDGRPAGLMKAFLEDRAGRLWFGGEKGLLRHDPASGAMQRFGDAGSSGPNVNVLYEDTRGTVWVGTEGSGLRRLAPGSYRFETIRSPVPRENYVYALLEDRTGALWVGTYGGLRRRDPATGAWTTYRADPSNPASLGDPWVTALLEDRTGALWVGTGAGLDRFDATRGTFVHYRHAPTDTTTLAAGSVFGLHESRDGALWVIAGALNRLDPRTGRVVRLTSHNNPLLSRVLYGLVEDRAGGLWLNTPGGIVRFDPARRVWRRYETGPVVLPTDQAFSARLRTRAGRVFFGAQNGYFSFDPGALRDNPHSPPVVLTGLDLDERPVRPGADSPLRVALPYADTVRLAHDDRLIRFTFAAMQFSDPDKNTYTYRLEGFDDRWHTVSHETWATFTNLPPGHYTFRVRAASADGVWSADTASVQVFVAPPWWATGWFRLLAALTLLGALYAAFRVRVRALATRNRDLEEQVVRRTAEIEQQRAQLARQAETLMMLDQTKTHFFSNISHEFRTPLTLIQGYLEDLSAETPLPAPSRNRARLIGALTQTQRLSHLVEELLDLTRLQENRLRLHLTLADMSMFVRRAADAFSSLAERRNVTLTVDAPSPLLLRFDPERMEQVLTNLLGNALRFTPSGGHVQVQVTAEPGAPGAGEAEAVLRVTDTGPGIGTEALPHLFERFYQADDSSTRTHSGLGIGLALVKELVTLHGGRVLAESTPGMGSTFTVCLPIEAHVADRDSALVQRPVSDPSSGGDGTAGPRLPEIARYKAALVTGAPEPVLAHVLVVEDHAELRAFVHEHLSPTYRVTTAVNGRDAWAQIQKHPPDLIVSDIMMPEMDGLELLARVKGDGRYRTIPLILLTAKSDPQDRLDGLEAKADVYLAKPFAVAELKAQVRNLVGLRHAIAQESGRQVVAVQPEDMLLEDSDAAFVRSIQAVLAEHLREEDFNVSALAAALFMSERTLRRRIKDVTGFSAGAYLRHVRLLHAKTLFEQRSYQTTSEVAHAVGFKSVPYFARRFTEAFDTPPP